jgi:ATP-binding cassette subfamily C protein
VGKSTLAALLAGTLTAQSGVVRLGNVDVSRLDPAALARHRVLIPQEAYVFTGTVRENLSYLDPEAAVEAAVAALGLESFVTRLGGYEAIVSPGRLSAGERQLVALARAYLSPARLAILDEATCHLDPATEARVESAFAARPGALVVVAHRVSSALRARRILLLDGSEAVVGDHQRLLERSALYRDLVGHWHHTHPGPATRLADGSAGGSAGRHRRPAPRPTPRPVP